MRRCVGALGCVLILLAMLATPVLALSNETVYLEGPRLEIPIPEGYYGFTPETVAEDPDVARVGLGEKDVQYLVDHNVNLYITSGDPSCSVMVLVQEEGEDGLFDLSLYDEKDGQRMVDSIKAPEADVKEWSWASVGAAKYIVLEVVWETTQVKEYVTRFNGFSVVYGVISEGVPLSQEATELLEQVVESSHFTETLPMPQEIAEKIRKAESKKARKMGGQNVQKTESPRSRWYTLGEHLGEVLGLVGLGLLVRKVCKSIENVIVIKEGEKEQIIYFGKEKTWKRGQK